MIKSVISLALAVCMTFGSAAALPKSEFDRGIGITASAETGNGNDLSTRTLDDGTLEICGYTGNGGTVIIPSKIGGKKVTKIAASAFDLGLYPNTVCPTKIIISEGIKEIGKYAFYGCSKLVSVNMPSTLRNIDNCLFEGCKNLKEINVAAGGKYYCSVKGVMYTKDKKELLYCPQKKTSVTIPKGVQYIGFQAFQGSQITSVTLPDSVTAICGDAFRSSRIKSINIPRKVDFIGQGAFLYCEDLESITVSSKNKYFNSVEGVLYNKDKTELIECPQKKKSLTVPNTVRNIRAEACDYSKIESLTLPDKLTSIGDWAFFSCTRLKTVKLPNSLNSLGRYAFCSCTGITSITIPGSVRSVGDGAFSKCKKLTSAVISYGVETVGVHAFSDCTKLKSVTIPSSVKSIGEKAFGYYDADPELTIDYKKVSGFTIYGMKGSAAEKYAKNNGFAFTAAADGNRLAGSNRYDTAAVIAKSIQNRSSAVILASGEGYADALAGVPLAKYLGAPILLTSKNSLSSEALSEIKRRKATKVIILGGEGAVSKNVENKLKRTGFKTVRLAGTTRYGTAVEIAENMDSAPTEIFFASANGFADALSVSSAAAIKSAPILYLNKDGKLDSKTKQYLQKLRGKVKKAYVIGGEGVISNNMMKQAAAALGLKSGSTVKRIWGQDRYETCIAVNKTFSAIYTGKKICVATGRNYPDALAGGVYAAQQKACILLADSEPNKTQKKYLAKKSKWIFTALGGTGAVSEELFRKVRIASV